MRFYVHFSQHKPIMNVSTWHKMLFYQYRNIIKRLDTAIQVLSLIPLNQKYLSSIILFILIRANVTMFGITKIKTSTLHLWNSLFLKWSQQQ